MEAHQADAKRRLRLQLGERRRGVPPAEAGAAALAVAEQLVADRRLRAARRIALYAAVAGELPSRPLFEALAVTGAARLLPRVRGEDLEWARVDRWEELVPGPFGILAPPPEAAAQSLSEGDVVLVPGVAFDARGWRLGRGRGFYDRAFPPGVRGPVLVGVAYAFQLVDAVPHDSRDRRVDAIVTERGIAWVEGE